MFAEFTEQNIKQIKMSNGEEIVCNIINFNSAGQPVTIDHVLQVIECDFYPDDDPESMTVNREYLFKSWMLLQYDIERFITINPSNIVSLYDPDPVLVARYLQTIKNVKSAYNDVMYSEYENSFDSAEIMSNVVSIFGKPTKH